MTKRHLRAGYYGLAIYLLLGVVLEGLHATKAGFYLDEGNETRRLLFRLAHAHGALIALINLVYGLTLREHGGSRVASASLIAAMLALPAGFFLGGVWARGGDPGVGIALVPVGAGLLLIGLISAARAL